MARKKIKLAFIENHSQRKATFNKRKGVIIKKLTEITTLCDVEACAIIYSSFDQNPVVWPSEEEARRVAVEFKARPEMDKSKKMVDQQAHLEQRITKTNDKKNKLKRETKELEMEQVLSQSFMGNWMMKNMNISDLNNLGYMADRYLSNVMRNIKIRYESGLEIGESSNVVSAASEGTASTMVMASTTDHMAPIYEVGGSSSSFAAFYPPVQQQSQFQHPLSAPIQEVGGSYSSSAAFYRPTQQQPHIQYPPLTPHVGQSQNLNPGLNHNRNQQPWYLTMMNYHAQLSSADHNQQQHQQQYQPQPHQQTIGDSTNSTAAPSPNNDVRATDPNPTNNI